MFTPVKPNCRGARRLAVAVSSGQQIIPLQCGNTTLKLPMRTEHVAQLRAGIVAVMQTFVDKQAAERPRRWDSLECKLTGDLSI